MAVGSFQVNVSRAKPRYGESFFVLESANKGQNLQFIQHCGGKDSQRQRELQLSELRAHAARVAHHNKRKVRAQKLAEGHDWSDESESQKTVSTPRTSVSRSPSPLSFAIAQSTRDPFETSVLSTVPQRLLSLLDIAWVNLVHAFRPEQPGLSYPDILPWRREIAIFPAITYSVIAGAATMSLTGRNYLSSNEVKTLEEARFQYTALAVTEVRKELVRREPSVSDTLLFAVLCLGSHDGVEPEIEEDRENTITSPLTTGSALNLLARLKMSSMHFSALVQLLNQKGGLDTVKLPVWKEMMAFIALVQATKAGTRPLLPFVESQTVTLLVKTKAAGVNQSQPKLILPLGFAETTPIRDDYRLSQALKNAYRMTQYVEKLCKGSCTDNIHKINNLRNKTQYLLTSLVPKPITAESSKEDCLYEVCRLSALEFSDMIIFPTPALTEVRSRLASQLLAVLQTPQIQKCWRDHSDFLNWATTIGAIGSTRISYNRQIYTEIFERRVVFADLPDFLTNMRRFLWSDLLSNHAQTIWVESRAYRTPESIGDM